MRRLLLITVAMVLFGCSTGLAQVADQVGGPVEAPVGGTPAPMPQVSPPPAGSPGAALGGTVDPRGRSAWSTGGAGERRSLSRFLLGSGHAGRFVPAP